MTDQQALQVLGESQKIHAAEAQIVCTQEALVQFHVHFTLLGFAIKLRSELFPFQLFSYQD